MKNFSLFIWTGAIRNFECASKQKLYWKKIWAFSKALQTHLEKFRTSFCLVSSAMKSTFCCFVLSFYPIWKIAIVLVWIEWRNKQSCSYVFPTILIIKLCNSVHMLRKLKLLLPLVEEKQQKKKLTAQRNPHHPKFSFLPIFFARNEISLNYFSIRKLFPGLSSRKQIRESFTSDVVHEILLVQLSYANWCSRRCIKKNFKWISHLDFSLDEQNEDFN